MSLNALMKKKKAAPAKKAAPKSAAAANLPGRFPNTLSADSTGRYQVHKVIRKAKHKFGEKHLKDASLVVKPSQLCWLLVSDTQFDDRVQFTYALRAKDSKDSKGSKGSKDTFYPLKMAQEKQVVRDMDFTNLRSLADPKTKGINYDVVGHYGNRLPSVGPVAKLELLQQVGFVSDRFAPTLCKKHISTFDDIAPRQSLDFKEKRRYLPKELRKLVEAAGTPDPEMDVDELANEEDEEDSEILDDDGEDQGDLFGEEDEEGVEVAVKEDVLESESDDDDDSDDSDDDDSVSSEAPAKKPATPKARPTPVAEPVRMLSESQNQGRKAELTVAGNDPININETVVEAQLRLRSEVIAKDAEPHVDYTDSKRAASPVQKTKPVKRQKVEAPPPPSPKSNPVAKKPPPKPIHAPAAAVEAPKPAAKKRTAPEPKAPAAKRQKSASAATPEVTEGYFTVDWVTDVYSKIMANPKLKALFLDEQLLDCLRTDFAKPYSLRDLVDGNVMESHYECIAFLAELIAHESKQTVPIKAALGSVRTVSEHLAEEVVQAQTADELRAMLQDYIAALPAPEPDYFDADWPLLELVKRAWANRDNLNANLVRTVFYSHAKLRPGVSGESQEQQEAYRESIKADKALQKRLVNYYMWWLEMQAPAEEAPDEDSDEELPDLF